MAAKDPLYLETTTLLNQEIQQKELRFKLYLFQHTQGERNRNERAVLSMHAPHEFGSIVVHDWTIRDGPNLQDKIVANAQGWNVFKEPLNLSMLITCTYTSVLVTKIGPWGGNGGKEFDIPESVPQRLESVTIRSGVAIDSIAFSYINQAGKKQTLGPWGGDGELTDTITFAPLEIVKEVSGTSGTFGGDTVVTSLTFVTNVRTYGPFGKPNGTAFSAPLTDTNVVGFFVHAGRLVNAVGVYARPSVQNY
ncbi:protein GOS9-like [Triticum aestivum]|uniref:protein GOS9-like n=1 Tax=Triticum aestivum TaxID=4565 RepID=UPI001D0204F9|nr:protein GOS9-like [Triticum aestivum]